MSEPVSDTWLRRIAQCDASLPAATPAIAAELLAARERLRIGRRAAAHEAAQRTST